MNWREVEEQLIKALQKMYDAGESTAIANDLLEHVSGMQRHHRKTIADQSLTETQMELLADAQQRLLQGEPLQYIINTAYFHGLKLYVDNRVLIPRPETEELVEWVLDDLKQAHSYLFQSASTTADQTNEAKIMDVGTGSGCIALAIKKAAPLAEVWGCDASDDALAVARRNGAELDIRVDFQAVDFLNEQQQRSLPTVHIVVSNPPYIPINEASNMHSNVKDWEPHAALFVPDEDALLFYRALIQFGQHRLYDGGSIYAELHFDKAQEVEKLFKEAGYETMIKKDMQGVERMIRARKP